MQLLFTDIDGCQEVVAGHAEALSNTSEVGDTGGALSAHDAGQITVVEALILSHTTQVDVASSQPNRLGGRARLQVGAWT